MAANSKAERIAQNIVSAIEGIQSGGEDVFAEVARVKLGQDKLESLAAGQLPYVAVTCGLPDPTPKPARRTQTAVDKYVSQLIIGLNIYGMDNTDPDQTILSLADDLWAGILADPSRGGLALHTNISPELETGVFDPHFVFMMDVEVKYVHTRSSI